jgi:hypothetical protein
MIIADLELKSPSIPFSSKGEIFFLPPSSLFAKHALSKAEGRGRGDLGRNGGGNYSTNFGSRALG